MLSAAAKETGTWLVGGTPLYITEVLKVSDEDTLCQDLYPNEMPLMAKCTILRLSTPREVWGANCIGSALLRTVLVGELIALHRKLQ